MNPISKITDEVMNEVQAWHNNWNNLMAFLEYSEAIRRIIYTINAIESLNSQLRKVTKNKRALLYLAYWSIKL